jgi:hypothetical protein
VVSRAVGKENKEVNLDGHAFLLRLVVSRLEKFVDDCWVQQWEAPLKTV